jgi:hypothetical protein
MFGMEEAGERLRAEALPGQPDAQVEEAFAQLHRGIEALEAERLRRLADLDRRRIYERDGHLSTALWLIATFGLAWGAARELVRVARALEHMPETRRALDAGEISTAAATVLVAARHADHDVFARCEPELVEAARIHRVNELQRVAAYWRQAVEAEQRVQDHDTAFGRRRLHASPTMFGSVRVDGDLDAETGATLLTAFRAIIDAESRTPDPSDARTPAQRRADALGEICRQWLDRADRPAVGGERPHVTVMIDASALAGEGAARRELEHVGPVPFETAERLTCDASIRRVVMAGASEPLDVGRRTSVVPPAIRAAVIARDGRCRLPGCDRHRAWCDAHHISHWARGGRTCLRKPIANVCDP